MGRVSRTALFALLLVVGLVQGVPSASAMAAGGQVGIGGFAKVGRFGTAIVTIKVICRNARVADLVIDVSQGTRSGTLTGTRGLVCDGRWHVLRPEVAPRLVDPKVDGPFERGWARVDARLSLENPSTGDPLPQAVDSAAVFLRAPVDVKVGWKLTLKSNGNLTVPVTARCQRPWVEPDLSLEVTQAAGAVGGSAAGSFGIVCDGQWHSFRVTVGPNRSFVVGKAHVLAYLTVYDPDSFDPVDQASASVDRFLRRR